MASEFGKWLSAKDAPTQKDVIIRRHRFVLDDPLKSEVHEEVQVLCPASRERSGWMIKSPDAKSAFVLEEGWAVTHWMPLPDDPTSGA